MCASARAREEEEKKKNNDMVDLMRRPAQTDHETVQIILQSVTQYREKQRTSVYLSRYVLYVYIDHFPIRKRNEERMKNA